MSAAAVSLAIGACNTMTCDGFRPIRLSQATIAVLSQAEVDQALAHNEFGRRVCGWRPN